MHYWIVVKVFYKGKFFTKCWALYNESTTIAGHLQCWYMDQMGLPRCSWMTDACEEFDVYKYRDRATQQWIATQEKNMNKASLAYTSQKQFKWIH